MRKAILLLILAIAALPSQGADAPWPSKPIRLITGASAGSAVDLRARLYAQKLAEGLGQPVIVDNRPGGSGAIAGDALLAAAPDGYTLLMTSNSDFIINPLLSPQRWDPMRDFVPVAIPIAGYLLLGVNAGTGVANVGELVKLAHAKPGKLNCGTVGNASVQTIGCWMLRRATNTEFGDIPYKGSAQVALALSTGEIDIGMTVTFDQVPHIKNGKIRPIAVLGPNRLHSTPEVPTMGEAGYEGMDLYVYSIVAAPAGTPEAILDRLNQEFTRAASHPDVARSIAFTGGAYPGYSTAQTAAFVRAEYARWKKLIAESGVKAQ